MGLFSDKCDCGAKVKKAARFCNTCGKGAPGGWVKCYSCGKWVGNESKHCAHCNYDLKPEERGQIYDNKFSKDPTLLLSKLDLKFCSARTESGLTLDTGQMAFVVDGDESSLVESGNLDVKSLAKIGAHAWLLNLDLLVVPLWAEKVQSADLMEFDVYSELIVTWDQQALSKNGIELLASKENLSLEQVKELVSKAAKDVSLKLVRAYKLSELLFNPHERINFDTELQKVIRLELSRLGLRVIHFAVPQLEGKEMRQAMAREKDKVEAAKELEYNLRMREILQEDNLDQLKSEDEVKEYAAQLANQFDIKQDKRDHDLNLLQQVHRHEIDGKELGFKLAEETKIKEHNLAMATKEMAFDDKAKDHQIKQDKKQLNFDVEESEKWLDVKRKKNAVSREDEFARLEKYSKFDLQSLIAALPKAQAENLVKFNQANLREGQPDVVILEMINRFPEMESILKNKMTPDADLLAKLSDFLKSKS
ncbi:zinc ribbon domain-containing protein [Lentisphaera profundi]|uniref:Zinc ribbon domain-containing protein n=1 Tax=Lentisphaera profundi TaxID=1658616 RepID=A0ABY7VTK7_9BACT|nr:zinc ribbon domain-containing protein [Lentisphaera profundi]WDE96644.1 zinc ribbon domain-containing protein [Lentisphaera profundi]